jgi:hypothetical protein
VAGKATLRVIGTFNLLMRQLADMNYLLTNPVLLDDSALQGLLANSTRLPTTRVSASTLRQFAAQQRPRPSRT